ncbi:MAG: DinB family protein [Saprospiraceae bacterium]|nr:DinB family protein [Saprospiraceae bacterium]
MNEAIIQQIEFRLIECGIHRILQCLDVLDEEHLYYRPNKNTNSINNQILHLNGNVRQWLISSHTPKTDIRKREVEFDPSNRKTKVKLIELLDELEKDVRATFPFLLDADLHEMKVVQCYQETTLSIIIHVIEHFSYHLGQISYITKLIKDIDLGYYSNVDLNKINP